MITVAAHTCACQFRQPGVSGLPVGSAWQCTTCTQLWVLTTKPSSARVGAVVPFSGVWFGGQRRTADILYWKKQGTDVSRAANTRAAKAAAELAYQRDLAELRHGIAGGYHPQGMSVQAYRQWRAASIAAEERADARRPSAIARAMAKNTLWLCLGIGRPTWKA